MTSKRLAFWATLLIVLVSLAGCGGGAGYEPSAPIPQTDENPTSSLGVATESATTVGPVQGPPSVQGGSPPLNYDGPAIEVPRGASSFDVHTQPPSYEGVLDGEYNWAWYALEYSNQNIVEPRPVRLEVESATQEQYWVLLSDYSMLKWEVHNSTEAGDIQLNEKVGNLDPHSYVSALTIPEIQAGENGVMHIVLLMKDGNPVDAVSSITVTNLMPPVDEQSPTGYNIPVPQPTPVQVHIGLSTEGKSASTIYADDDQKVVITWDPSYDPGAGPLAYPTNMAIFRRQVIGGVPQTPLYVGTVFYAVGKFVDPDNVVGEGSPQPEPGATYLYRTYKEVPGSQRSLEGTSQEVTMPLFPPTAVQATGPDGDGEVDVTFTETFGATEYDIYRSDNPATPIATVSQNPDGDTKSWTDDGTIAAIPQNQVLSYWVKAVNTYAESDASESAFVSTHNWTAIPFGTTINKGRTAVAYKGENIVLAYVDATDSENVRLKCAVATMATPDGVEDFTTTTVVGLDASGVINLEVGVHTDGRIVVTYYDDGVGWYSAVSEVTPVDNWTVSEIATGDTPTNYTYLAMQMIADKPVVVYNDNGTVRYAYIDGGGNWSSYDLKVGYNVDLRALDVNVLEGKPVVLMMGETGSDSVTLCHGVVAEPSSGDNTQWNRYYIRQDSTGVSAGMTLVGTTLKLALGEPKPMYGSTTVAELDLLGPDEELAFVPAAPNMQFEPHNTVVLRYVDGLPWMFMADAGGPSVRIGTQAAPVDANDWIRVGPEGTSADRNSVAEAEVCSGTVCISDITPGSQVNLYLSPYVP